MQRSVWVAAIVAVLACGGKEAAPPAPPPEQSKGPPAPPPAPEEKVLAVNVVGDGTVHSAAGDCRSNCTQRAAKGAKIILVAEADAGAVFAGWSGACTGQACEVTLDGDAAVTARFDRPPPPPVRHHLTVQLDGQGSVRSSPQGIDCGTSCDATYDQGAQVALMAVPAAGYSFGGWDGACVGAGACAVTMGSDALVIARFTPLPPKMYAINVSVTGHGKVSGQGIDCPGAACAIQLAEGAHLTLTASPAAGARFTAWGGDCAGAACDLTVTKNLSVTASFEDEVVMLAGSDGTNQNVIAINSTDVFYARYGSNVYGLWRLPKAGGTAQLITSAYCCFSFLVADDAYVYWANYNALYRSPVSGGAAQQLWGGQVVNNLVLDGDRIFWVTAPSYDYTTGRSTGSVYSAPASGGSPQLLATGDVRGGLAVDSQFVYWTQPGGVFRAPRAGGLAEQVLDCGSSCIAMTVKVDFDTVYYRDSTGDTWARAKAGGASRKLSTGNPGNPQVWGPLELDVQSKVAYWSWRDGTGATLQGIFSANADGTRWTPVDSGTDTYWYGPRVDDKYIFYFHAGALYRRLK